MRAEELSKAQIKRLEINEKEVLTPYLPVSDTMLNRISRLNSSLEDNEIKMPIESPKIKENRAVMNEKRHNHVSKLKSCSQKSDFLEDLADRITTKDSTSTETINLGYVGMEKKHKEGLSLSDRKKLVISGEKSGVDAFILNTFKTTSIEKILSEFEELQSMKIVQESDMKLIPTLDLTLLKPSDLRRLVKRMEEKYTREDLPIIAFEALFPSTNETKITKFTETVSRHTMSVDPEQTVTLKTRREEVGGRARLSHALAHLGVDIPCNYLHTSSFSPEEPINPEMKERRFLSKNIPFYETKKLAKATSNYPDQIPFSVISEFEDSFDYVDLTNLNNEVTDFKQFEELREILEEEGIAGYLSEKRKVKEMLVKVRA